MQTLVMGPGLGGFETDLAAAFGGEYTLYSAYSPDDMIDAVRDSEDLVAAVVLNSATPLPWPAEDAVADIHEAFEAGGRVPAPPVLLLTHSPSAARAWREARASGVADAIALPADWRGLYTAVGAMLRGGDDPGWAGLNPVQRGLLKQTRRAMRKLEAAAAAGGPIDTGVLDDVSESVVEAGAQGVLLSSLEALRAHHSNTFGHSLKVAGFMTSFGVALGFGRGDLKLVAQAGLCHDLGKCVVPPEILGAPRKLTPAEFEIMKGHPLGARVSLQRTEGLDPRIVAAAECHHEKIDGSGYPHGLTGAELDDVALVCAIADVYAALTEKRAYKPKMSPAEAFGIMDGMSGPHLEPALYARFRESMLDAAPG